MFDVLSLGSLYNSDYIDKQQDSYVWSEKQSDSDALATVEFVFKNGHIGYISSGLLQKMQSAYRIKGCSALKLRKICDGILFLDRDNDHYIIVLEVKSSFNEVKSNAIFQIPASYVKVKSILNDFSNYKAEEYKELGLIISYPYVEYAPTDAENNHIVIDNKLEMIGDRGVFIASKYVELLKNHKEAVFDGKDFEFDGLKGVKPELYFEKLKVKHFPVKNKSVSAEIDLDEIVK